MATGMATVLATGRQRLEACLLPQHQDMSRTRLLLLLFRCLLRQTRQLQLRMRARTRYCNSRIRQLRQDLHSLPHLPQCPQSLALL